jgi:aspartyl-tRNA(Asn)/glutamyl-tRNA(Gln) amidotransferase subunit A
MSVDKLQGFPFVSLAHCAQQVLVFLDEPLVNRIGGLQPGQAHPRLDKEGAEHPLQAFAVRRAHERLVEAQVGVGEVLPGSPFHMSEIAFLSATELLELYRGRALSPVEATEAALRQIELHDPRVNAYCLVDAKRALAQARKSEERYVTGEPRGRFDGVPASIKDVLLTREWPTLRGTRTADPGQEWDEDSPVAARMREHGAILLGKTTTPEYGWKGVTDSPLTGFTVNPWAPTRTAGGPSGGSAAAVAFGMGPLSVGTDGGGSVRIPAAFCGIAGQKPTNGRVPFRPASPFGTLAHAGSMARTVADAALMLGVLSPPDARDWTSLPPA